MSNLHAYFALRNQQGFARALDGGRSQANTQAAGPSLSSSGGKSWTRISALSSSLTIDVNARDALGRTVLHIACATPEPFALAYVQLLLVHPNINVNIQDTESRWSALHRAFYAGNLAACILLLQRSDIDTQLRDYDGYTPFDLYNSTIEGTRPEVKVDEQADTSADLFTWGANRNAALGHGDADDRTYPDQVIIQKSDIDDIASPARFTLVQVKGISMAKLHTTVITDEKPGNLRACGFGSGGRLGPGQHTQYNLLPVPQFNYQIIAVALGQDHSLAVSSEGEVLSWGLNRFSQLGYIVEPATPAGPLHTRAMEEPIQAVARKVVGPLKKEVVVGVAACKTASACWTGTDVFTWGTNSGQLGYDRAAQPVQILPRKVTAAQDVKALALTDSAMACLLNNMDVVCFKDDTHFRVKFPAPEISDLSSYQHPHLVKPMISKITSCDDVFAALSSRGDIFTLSVPPAAPDSVPGKSDRAAIKPQRVWSLRKSFDPAKDIALGSEGELIVCTAAGHVFVRSRHLKGGKSLKFHRVPFIHRAVSVCANSTGAFAALRLNYTPKALHVSGPSFTDDLREIRPWMRFGATGTVSTGVMPSEDEEDGGALEADVTTVTRLCALLSAEKESQKHEGRGLFRGPVRLAHGADVYVQAGLDIPAHRVILVARSSALHSLIEGTTSIIRDGTVTVKYFSKGSGRPRVAFAGCQTMTVLLLLDYLYSDDVPALWDRRVGLPCGTLLARLKIGTAQVKTELEALARALNLPALSAALATSAKRVPSPTLSKDMERLFLDTLDCRSSTGSRPDVLLELADRRVACHSVVLRARSAFFRSFFDDEDWTVNRWRPDGVLEMDMKHLGWRAMSFVMAWICHGKEQELFEHLDSVKSVPDLLELVFSVMAASSELLLDRLMLICSSVILRHVTLTNAPSLLTDASYYNALPLVESLQDYVTSNMEAILESRLLDDVQGDVIKNLALFVQKQQTTKSPALRTNKIGEKALLAHADWLALQDIPQPLVRSQRPLRESPRLSPVGFDKGSRRPSDRITSPLSSPALASTAKALPQKPSQGDDIFSMEDDLVDAIPALNIGQPRTPPTEYTVPSPAWKSRSTQASSKVDMKAIMAEAETVKNVAGTSSGVPISPSVGNETVEYGSKRSQKPSQRERRRLHPSTSEDRLEPIRRIPNPDSPWKLPVQPPPSTSANSASTFVQGPRPSPLSPAATGVDVQSPALGATTAKVSKTQPVTPASILQASDRALKPVVSPATPGSLRRTSSDAAAWTNVPVHEPTPSPVSGLSFAAIQQQQRDQRQQPKGKRSLREIQEEERAKQEEEDFLRWWNAEEERLKAEAASQILNMDAGASNKRGRGTRKESRGSARGKRGGQRGRGGSTAAVQ